MTVRPIIFSGPMVKALLAGRKTQTRRVIKPTPYNAEGDCVNIYIAASAKYVRGADGRFYYSFEHPRGGPLTAYVARHNVGDLLWVRETIQRYNGEKPEPTAQYAADITPVPHRGLVPGWCDGRAYWRWQRAKLPSIHMPRWASRLTLKVTGVKVERLQEISVEDAKAEGAGLYVPGHGFVSEADLAEGYSNYLSPRMGFEAIWTEIHGPGSWDANPWVVAISFDVLKQNVDSLANQDKAR